MNLFEFEIAYREYATGKPMWCIIEAVDMFEATRVFAEKFPNDHYVSVRSYL